MKTNIQKNKQMISCKNNIVVRVFEICPTYLAGRKYSKNESFNEDGNFEEFLRSFLLFLFLEKNKVDSLMFLSVLKQSNFMLDACDKELISNQNIKEK